MAHKAFHKAVSLTARAFARAGLAGAIGTALLWGLLLGSGPALAAKDNDAGEAKSEAAATTMAAYVPLFSSREVRST